MNLQKDVLAYKKIMLVGKCGQGKSQTGNKFINKIEFSVDDAFVGVTQRFKIHGENNHGITIIDTPGFNDTANDNLFEDAFIDSAANSNLLRMGAIDTIMLVVKLRPKAVFSFLEESKIFVKYFGKLAIPSLLILCIQEGENILSADDLRDLVESSDGYKYLKIKNNNCDIPYCRWNNLGDFRDFLEQDQIVNLKKALSKVKKPFCQDYLEYSFQLIKNQKANKLMKNFSIFPKEPFKDKQFSLISLFELLRHICTVIGFLVISSWILVFIRDIFKK